MDEGVRFARYMDQASHGLVRRLFGPRYDLIIGRAYLSSGHDMSYQTAIFAELGVGKLSEWRRPTVTWNTPTPQTGRF